MTPIVSVGPDNHSKGIIEMETLILTINEACNPAIMPAPAEQRCMRQSSPDSLLLGSEVVEQ
jgi:hypothetical protein